MVDRESLDENLAAHCIPAEIFGPLAGDYDQFLEQRRALTARKSKGILHRSDALQSLSPSHVLSLISNADAFMRQYALAIAINAHIVVAPQCNSTKQPTPAIGAALWSGRLTMSRGRYD